VRRTRYRWSDGFFGPDKAEYVERAKATAKGAEEDAEKAGKPYLFQLPRKVPEGKVLVHVSDEEPNPLCGFDGHFWARLEPPGDRWNVPCECGWAKRLGQHYRRLTLTSRSTLINTRRRRRWRNCTATGRRWSARSICRCGARSGARCGQGRRGAQCCKRN
jgi:hypothetical protein